MRNLFFRPLCKSMFEVVMGHISISLLVFRHLCKLMFEAVMGHLSILSLDFLFVQIHFLYTPIESINIKVSYILYAHKFVANARRFFLRLCNNLMQEIIYAYYNIYALIIEILANCHIIAGNFIIHICSANSSVLKKIVKSYGTKTAHLSDSNFYMYDSYLVT